MTDLAALRKVAEERNRADADLLARYSAAYASQDGPDAKLMVMANYGEMALTRLKFWEPYGPLVIGLIDRVETAEKRITDMELDLHHAETKLVDTEHRANALTAQLASRWRPIAEFPADWYLPRPPSLGAHICQCETASTGETYVVEWGNGSNSAPTRWRLLA